MRVNLEWVREPRGIDQPEHMACLSCVYTNILYAAGKVDASWSVTDSDTVLGRKPNEAISTNVFDLALFAAGFEIDYVESFSTKRFIDEGITYLREYYGDTWSGDEFDSYWTSEKVFERQQIRLAEEAEYEPYKSQFRVQERQPTIDDVKDFIDDDRFVVVSLHGSTQSVVHGALVYGWDEGVLPGFKIYKPRLDGYDGLEIHPPSLLSGLLSVEGIKAVRPCLNK